MISFLKLTRKCDDFIAELENEGYDTKEIGIYCLSKGNSLLDDDLTDVLINNYLQEKDKELNLIDLIMKVEG